MGVSLPNNWSTTSTAGNATLSMSTDAHSGSYSVKVAGDSKYNKRISYKEIELKAGEYTMTFYAKLPHLQEHQYVRDTYLLQTEK